MAGVDGRPLWLRQMAAVAQLQWRLVGRTGVRGVEAKRKLTVISMAFSVLFSAGLGTLLATLTYRGLAAGSLGLISVLLWFTLPAWQFLALQRPAASGYSELNDPAQLIRFPVSYRSFVLVRLAYIISDRTNLGRSLTLMGVAVGAAMVSPRSAPEAIIACAGFAALNIVLAQAILTWLERFLSQRRTRELFSVVMLLIYAGFRFMRWQLVSPMVAKLAANPASSGALHVAFRGQALLPPGVAAEAIVAAVQGRWLVALGQIVLLGGWVAAMCGLLHLRWRKQYRGENLSQASAPKKVARKEAAVARPAAVAAAPRAGSASGIVSAVAMKEYHYLLRSPQIWYQLLMPFIVLVGILQRRGAGGNHWSDIWTFPAITAYTAFLHSNVMYNIFGTDGTGMQFWFLAPVKLREVLFAKNLVQSGMLIVGIAVVWAIAFALYGAPPASAIVSCAAGVLFALMVNLSLGNLISLSSPLKADVNRLGRQRRRGWVGWAIIGLQVAIGGCYALTLTAAYLSHLPWLAPALLLFLIAAAAVGYGGVVQSADEIGLARRELIMTLLAKAS